MRRGTGRWWRGLLLTCVMGTAQAGLPPPKDLAGRAGFDQHLDAQVSMTLPFIDADGQRTDLARIANGRPLLLSLGYYHCPNLCDLVLQGMARSTAVLPLQVGSDYQVVFVSIDPDEKPADARSSMTMLDHMLPAAKMSRWHLLTGSQDSIRQLAATVGYRYFRDPRNGQFAHPAGWVVLTAQGRVAQYFFGVSYPPSSLRLALVDASRGKLGSLADRLVLLCCGYDPSTGRYSLLVGRVMQGLGVGFVVLLLVLLYRLRRRSPA
jgi:protein SCO1/2